MIQQEWGDFEGVNEKSLMQQLLRLKKVHASQAFQGKAQEDVKPIPKRTSNVNVLHELAQLADVQRQRVLILFAKEQELKLPISGLNTVVMDYKDMLISIQKVQFDLGLCEFKGPVQGQRVIAEQVTKPDGTTGQRVIVEAVNTLEEVMSKRRGTPPELTSGIAS
jgi:hypothetical protein